MHKAIKVAAIDDVAHVSLRDLAIALSVPYKQLFGAATSVRLALGQKSIPEEERERWVPVDEALVVIGRVGFRAGDKNLARCIEILREYRSELVGKLVDYKTIGTRYRWFQQQADAIKTKHGDKAVAAYWAALCNKFACRPFKLLPLTLHEQAVFAANEIIEKINKGLDPNDSPDQP